MCGIVGLLDLRGDRPVERSALERMNQVQHHRGPDETGYFTEPGLGFGHKRLSIIDLANGQQPMTSRDGRYVILYNGEVYNFRELRRELEEAGHVFTTHCDTEVLLYAYAQWGTASVERLRGMFAYGVWDRERKELFLSRDRLGIKPLYYAVLPDGRLAFSSELKSIAVLPQLDRSIDPHAVENYLALGYVPDPDTIYASVRKLEPGHRALIRRGTSAVTSEKYWDLPFGSTAAGDVRDTASELLARVQEAVKIRLVSEVPLGAFLSGGVDSSAVVALMAGLSDDPVKTCSISFGDPAYNEKAYADRVAARYSTDHRVRQVDPDDIDLVDGLCGLFDEPFADSSAIPTYRVCQLAREKVTVALSGDGGDENLAGYRRYRWHMNEEIIRGLMPGALRRPLFGLAGRLYPKLDWAPRVLRAKSTLQALARDSADAYLHSVSVTPDHIRAGLYSESFRSRLQGYQAREVFRRHARAAPTEHGLSLVQYIDFKTYLPGDILTKVDRSSMAHALEVRVPLLDHQLVEWISGLPPQLKLKGQEGKYVLKEALRPLLGEDILFRPKMGFAVPLEKWFRGALASRLQDALSSPVMQDSGIFHMPTLSKLVEQHRSGRWNHTATLWSLMMFESFLRRECTDTVPAPVVPLVAGAALA